MPSNPHHRPTTEAERAEVLRLHGGGKGRNEIATVMGRSQAWVSKIVKAEGGTFDRAAQTAVGVRARQSDLRIRRQGIIERLYGRVENRLDKLEGNHWRTLVGDGPGVQRTADLDFVPAGEERNESHAIGSYLASAAKLEAVDGDGGVEQARSMLSSLHLALAHAFTGDSGQPLE